MNLSTVEIDGRRDWQWAYLTISTEAFFNQVLVSRGKPLIHKGEKNMLEDSLNVKYDRMFPHF